MSEREPDGPTIEIIRRLVRRLLPSALFKERWAETKYADTQVPTYNAATGKFEPGTPSGTGAPTDAQYVTLATDATLSVERVLTAGTAISVTDAGAGSTVTVAHAQVATGDLHTEYRLESADHSHATTGAQAGQLDHGAAMTGASLADDDHSLYLLASDATNRATFAANWLDLTDTGATTLHTHSGGSGHTIRRNGTDMAAETGLNFIDTDNGTTTFVNDDPAPGGAETEVYLSTYLLNNIGRATPQVIIGGTADNASLVLKGTSSATHTTSTIDLNDDPNIATGKLIKYNNATWITPDSSVGAKFAGSIGILGTTPPTNGHSGIYQAVSATVGGGTFRLWHLEPTIYFSNTTSATVSAIYGVAKVYPKGAATLAQLEGLNFQAQLVFDSTYIANGETATVTALFGAAPRLAINMIDPGDGRTCVITNARTGYFGYPLFTVFTPGTSTITVTDAQGVDIAAWNQSTAGVTITNAINLRVGDITGTSFTAANNRVVQFGTATPTTTKGLFEMMANFTAAANATPIWISEGATPTRRQLKTVVESSLDTTSGTKLICYLA